MSHQMLWWCKRVAGPEILVLNSWTNAIMESSFSLTEDGLERDPWDETTERNAYPWVSPHNSHKIWKICTQMLISTSEIRSWRNKALPRFIYPVLDRRYRLWNMMIVSTLNSGDWEETLIEFPFGENSKSLPRAFWSKSSSGYKSSYTGGFLNIDLLMWRISAR